MVREVTLDDSTKVGGKQTVAVEKGIKITSPKKIEIVSTEEIALGVGSSTIVMKPTGIEISAPKISSSAIGIHQISGALIKIN
jgi:type VI secretion system secreted protein VgrG